VIIAKRIELCATQIKVSVTVNINNVVALAFLQVDEAENLSNNKL
jgi:hypothetical protein